jgi:hypothetical protein
MYSQACRIVLSLYRQTRSRTYQMLILQGLPMQLRRVSDPRAVAGKLVPRSFLP